MSSLQLINTKLEEYKLIHDPIHLLILLYSKYSDIEEDKQFLYINQLIFDKPTHYNLIFKEIKYLNFIKEFVKRFYFMKESLNRIPKLSDYYKNYHNFFCRPIFRNFQICEIMNDYGDKKAEIFYKNNYENEEKENESLNNNSSSSIDNITNNKTIFDKKIRYIIENNNSSNKYTLTLDTSRTLKSNLNLLSKRSNNDSFIKLISPFINYNKTYLNKKDEKTFDDNIHKFRNKNKLTLKNRLEKNNNFKSSLYNLVKNNLNCETIKYSKKKVLKSPKLNAYLSNYKSSLDEFNKNKIKYIEKVNNINDTIKNKTYNNNLNSKIVSKLSSTLNNNFSIGKNNSILNNKNKSNSKQKINKNSGNTIQRVKNKTFDIKTINSNNIIKFNSNSSTLKTNRKKNYHSNFNLVKSPINSINRFSNLSRTKFTKNCNNNSSINSQNSKNSIIRNNSSSISKNINNKNPIKNHRKNNTLDSNHLLFSIQKSINLNNILSPKNLILSNRINLNSNVSRNKKNIITHTQTNIKTYRKDSSHKTKSIDEEKLKLKNIFFGNKNNYQMSQRLVNQIEELIKKSKTPFLKYNNMNNLNNHKKKIYNNNSNCNSSIFNDHNGTNVSIKVNSSKTINANYMKINSVEKKENKFI